MTSAKVKAAKAAMYTELIVSAAERVFGREGYEATQVKLIAAESGLSLGTLYGTFGGKAEIWRAVHVKHLDGLFSTIGEASGPAPDADGLLDMLLAGIERYVRYMLEHPDFLQMHLRDGHAWPMSSGSGSQDLQVEASDRGRKQMAAAIGLGIELGVLAPDDPEMLARIMVGMHQVRLAHWVVAGMSGDHDEVVRGIQEQTLRAFCTVEAAPAALNRQQQRWI